MELFTIWHAHTQHGYLMRNVHTVYMCNIVVAIDFCQIISCAPFSQLKLFCLKIIYPRCLDFRSCFDRLYS